MLSGLCSLFVLAISGTAGAGTIHKFESSFGEAGSGPGQMQLVAHSGLAVNEQSGDVYVADTGNGRVDRFEADGTPLGSFGTFTSPTFVAVDNTAGPSSGDIYVADTASGTVSKFEADGTLVIGWGTVGVIDGSTASRGPFLNAPGVGIAGIGVGPEGDVYVYCENAEGLLVYRFAQDGTPVETFRSSFGSTIAEGLGLDSSRDIYLARGSGQVVKIEPPASPGGETARLSEGIGLEGEVGGLAVDPTSGDLYIAHGEEVERFAGNGSHLENFGQASLTTAAGPAVDAGDGKVFVASSGTSTISVFESLVVPSAVTKTATGQGAGVATLNGEVDPEGLAVSECLFEFGEDDSYGQTVPCAESESEIGAGTSPVPVHADLSGLAAGVTLHFRLTVGNANGSTSGGDMSLRNAELPEALTLLPFVVTPQSAEIRGEVNPGSGTSSMMAAFHIEYGITTAYGHSTAAQSVGPANLPINEYLPVGGTISALQPGTTYHYRVVAENAVGGPINGRDRIVTTRPSTPPQQTCTNEVVRIETDSQNLPNCRAYELVSPEGNGKLGGDILTDVGRTQAASEGSAIEFSSLRTFGNAVGTAQANEYISERSTSPNPGDSGWSTHSISPVQPPTPSGRTFNAGEPFYVGPLSEDLSAGVFRGISPLTIEPRVEDVPNLYTMHGLRSSGTPSPTLDTPCPLCVSSGPLETRQGVENLPWIAGASADFSHVLYEYSEALTAGSTATSAEGERRYNLYQAINGDVSLVGLIPPPGAVECGGPSGPACLPAPESFAGRGASQNRYTLNVISADGSRIVFGAGTEGRLEGNLYLRIDNERTVQLNVNETGTTPEPGTVAAQFATASSDGRRIFFTTSEALVAEDTDGANDLYMYTGGGALGHLTLISVDQNPGDQPNSVEGVLGTSRNGHYVYFLQAGQIVPGEPVLKTGLGVYLWHDGTVRYIGQLSNPAADSGSLTPRNWGLSPLLSRVTPDGQYLLMSVGDGSGFSGVETKKICGEGRFSNEVLTEEQEKIEGTVPCKALYLYEAGTDQLRCVSCNPSNRTVRRAGSEFVREQQGGALTTWKLNRALSADGRFVFFSTIASLLPEDTNGAVDAYEYESQTGELHLLSSGTSPDSSFFMDASADGRDVFIATDQRLVEWDTDTNYDIYDVRVDGGFPQPTATVAPCRGEVCQGAAPGAPEPPRVGSSNLIGSVKPPPRRKCAKGRHSVRRHKKHVCVSRRTSKQHRHGAHGKAHGRGR